VSNPKPFDLVTFEQAVFQERIDEVDENDPDISAKITAASRLVLRFLGSKSAFFLDTQGQVMLNTAGKPLVPEDVQAATLMLFGYLYRLRDSDAQGEWVEGWLPTPVRSMLHMIRKPTLA